MTTSGLTRCPPHLRTMQKVVAEVVLQHCCPPTCWWAKLCSLQVAFVLARVQNLFRPQHLEIFLLVLVCVCVCVCVFVPLLGVLVAKGTTKIGLLAVEGLWCIHVLLLGCWTRPEHKFAQFCFFLFKNVF